MSNHRRAFANILGINVTRLWPPAITGALDLVGVTLRNELWSLSYAKSPERVAKAPAIVKLEGTVPAHQTFKGGSLQQSLVTYQPFIHHRGDRSIKRLKTLVYISFCVTPDNTPLVRDIRSTPLT
ncbi:MAG: hypothetical protein Ct9H300mP11_31250 [Chloroflexota bacterium]|nr:MAG: hypothetical protein Ct9H300mP11_31250 [Chloroflexota bacterium]